MAPVINHERQDEISVKHDNWWRELQCEPKKSFGSFANKRTVNWNSQVQSTAVNLKELKGTFSPYEDSSDMIMDDEPKNLFSAQQKRGKHGQLYQPDNLIQILNWRIVINTRRSYLVEYAYPSSFSSLSVFLRVKVWYLLLSQHSNFTNAYEESRFFLKEPKNFNCRNNFFYTVLRVKMLIRISRLINVFIGIISLLCFNCE